MAPIHNTSEETIIPRRILPLLLAIIYLLWVIWGILLNSYSIIIFSIIQLFLILYITMKIYKNFNGNVSYNFREYMSKFK